MNRLLSVFALGGVAGRLRRAAQAQRPVLCAGVAAHPIAGSGQQRFDLPGRFRAEPLQRPQGVPGGDIITITLNEKTSASKNAGSQIAKNSKTNIGLTSLFGGTPNTNNPFGGGDLSLEAGYSGDRATKGDSKATQGNTLTGSITVTVAEVLPNGIIAVRGEKWLTLNTGEELVRIAGMVRADDIATDNTVPSTRVADARITYSGTGSFADASQPGWLDRFFLSPLWPF